MGKSTQFRFVILHGSGNYQYIPDYNNFVFITLNYDQQINDYHGWSIGTIFCETNAERYYQSLRADMLHTDCSNLPEG